MSVARACLQCRASKAKCDCVRPRCGRCIHRRLACSGYPQDESFIFLDENDVAQRNSERARSRRNESQMIPISFDLAASQGSSAPTFTERTSTLRKQLYHWLNERELTEIPPVLQLDMETQAVSRFFVNWTLYPCNLGLSPGYMDQVPKLYSNAAPHSILWLAVQAVAFADMKYYGPGYDQLSATALQYYGLALALLRTLAADEERILDDQVLAALLLIDDFESLFLGRTEPLGPHSQGLKHILHARGDAQLFRRSSFSLWLLALHRLVARQILLYEEPDDQQTAWIDKLDLDWVPLRIFSDIYKMNVLSSEANKLRQGENSRPIPRESIEQARQLADSTLLLLRSVETWPMMTIDHWKAETVDPNTISETDSLPNLPMPQFTCPRVLSYHDIWSAYMWSFHAASQIILRESLIDTFELIGLSQLEAGDPEDTDQIQHQTEVIHRLSAVLIRSFPQLLGFVHKDTSEGHFRLQGGTAGRALVLFPMRVLQMSSFSPPEHKQTALAVIEWVNSTYRLG
ncbi:hypothetical protein EDD37DRAFT_263033 [Exophiala viscosa]|uniref:uncharacterized protein n=1 Tax=Exophiala viscosa TaxID=2486360 RepID=UPI00219C8E5C|nr:hypothetical protein EDD37DRAFT_263033 [Exophiala viscosa]